MDAPSLGNAPFTKNNLRRAVLTPTKVMEIRKFYETGNVTQGQLSRDYGVSVVQIGRIVRGEVWQSLGAVAATHIQLEESAEKMMEFQREVERAGTVKEVVEAKGMEWAKAQLTPEARARLSQYQDVPKRPEVETPTKRVMPVSPLDEE